MKPVNHHNHNRKFKLTKSPATSSSSSSTTMLLVAVFLVLAASMEVSASHFPVKTLPGFDGDLPFTLETGYIEVGESELFYYFIESEGNPNDDPLMLWLTGGPGCSSLSVLVYEIGPFTFNYADSTLEKPVLKINPYSWTKAANLLFIDQPAGTGFSYAKTPEAYKTNDTSSSIGVYNFMRKWLVEHPKYLKNPFYLGADSYMGILLPMVAEEIFNGNEAGNWPLINIKGYVLGNPLTDTTADYNSRIPFAHSKALLSDEIYESAMESCHGEFLHVDPDNTQCVQALQVVQKCLARIRLSQILEPYCDTTNTSESVILRRDLRALDNTSVDFLSLPQSQKEWCRDDNYEYAPLWTNQRDVREALHVRPELDDIEWVRCNVSLLFVFGADPAVSYTHNVWSVVDYHRRLSDKKCRALIYSGDHDMIIPHLTTMNWVESLNFPVVDDWRPWLVDEQVAGYTKKYSKDVYNLTFATLKGGGHTAPEYKPKESLSMFKRWLDNDSL